MKVIIKDGVHPDKDQTIEVNPLQTVVIRTDNDDWFEIQDVIENEGSFRLRAGHSLALRPIAGNTVDVSRA